VQAVDPVQRARLARMTGDVRPQQLKAATIPSWLSVETMRADLDAGAAGCLGDTAVRTLPFPRGGATRQPTISI